MPRRRPPLRRPPLRRPRAPAAAPAAPIRTPRRRSINAKVGGWRYKIAGFQYDQMTRRMADLLKRRAGRLAPPRTLGLPLLTGHRQPRYTACTLRRVAMSTQPKPYPIAASYAPLIARARVYDVAIESPLDRAPRCRLGSATTCC